MGLLRQPAGVDREDAHRPGRSRRPCRSGRRRLPGTRSRARAGRRSGRAPTRAAPTAPGPRTRPRARRPPGRRAASMRAHARPPRLVASARSGRLAAGQHAELVVGRCRSQNDRKLSPSLRCRRASRRQALDRLVELLGRHAAEHRASDRGVGAERRRAGERRSAWWRLPSSSRTVVPWKPRSPTQCWAQACGQPSRCSRSSATSSPKRPSSCSIRRAEPRLRLGDARSCSAARPCSRSSRRAAGWRRGGSRSRASAARRVVDRSVRDAGEDEVLLARDADVAARAVGEVGDGRASGRREIRPRCTGTPTERRPSRARGSTPMWSAGVAVERRRA